MFTHKKSVWLFLLPGGLGLLFFYIVPFFGGVYYSLTDGSYRNAFVGMDNYVAIWKNQMFVLGLKNTMQLSLICAPLVWLLSFGIASLLNRLRPKGAFFRNSVLLPYLMPSSAMLLIWLVAFDYGGVINRLVTALGFSRVIWPSRYWLIRSQASPLSSLYSQFTLATEMSSSWERYHSRSLGPTSQP